MKLWLFAITTLQFKILFHNSASPSPIVKDNIHFKPLMGSLMNSFYHFNSIFNQIRNRRSCIFENLNGVQSPPDDPDCPPWYLNRTDVFLNPLLAHLPTLQQDRFWREWHWWNVAQVENEYLPNILVRSWITGISRIKPVNITNKEWMNREFSGD